MGSRPTSATVSFHILMSQATFRCLGCNTDATFYVIESRKLDFYIRRRKKCNTCGKRMTTYEIPSEHFDQLKEAQEVLSSLKKILETKGVTAVAGRTPTCEVCIHMNNYGKCTMDFPEAGGQFAAECSLYTELI